EYPVAAGGRTQGFLQAYSRFAERLIVSCYPSQFKVESRKGAVPAGPFPFPAHQTGRADFRHPAFRRTSYPAHAGAPPSRPLETVNPALSVHDCVGKLAGTA